MKMKKNLVLLFCILGGVIVGSLIASFASDISFLRWLSFSQTIGIPTRDPLYLDLAVVQIAFGLEMGVNVAQIITITLSLFLYKSLIKKL